MENNNNNNIQSDSPLTSPQSSDNSPEALDENANMSFLEHLVELRKRLILSVVGIIIGCIIVGVFISDLMRNVFLKPATDAGLELQNLLPFGQPFLYFKVIIAGGIVIAIPYIMYQFWLFISPALYKSEQR